MGENRNTIHLLNKWIAIIVELGLFNWRFQEVPGSAWLPRCEKATHLLSASSPVVVFAVPWMHQPIGRRKCSDFTSLGCRLIRYMYTLLFVYVRTLLRQTSSLCKSVSVVLLLLCKVTQVVSHQTDIRTVIWQNVFNCMTDNIWNTEVMFVGFKQLLALLFFTQINAISCDRLLLRLIKHWWLIYF